MKGWQKITITVIAVLGVTVAAIRVVAPEVLGIPYPPGVPKSSFSERIKLLFGNKSEHPVQRTLPDGSTVKVDANGKARGPLTISLVSLIINELEERLGISPDKIEDKSPEDVKKLVGDTFSPVLNVITSAHKWLNLYFWPEDESKTISLNQLKQEISELEKGWESAVAGIEEFKDIPAVEAFIEDGNKAFVEVRKSSIINRKPLVTAHNIFHDLESICSGTDPSPYGVTETEKILAEGTK
ncbi:hypothetical protein [Moorella sp. Hama-1]|uniref:hypothetical protein n=1 Tax=Moorella sp. Hama-1 TaxID=2138101 RepID=UPI000D64EC0B|nr:hypothetical protein [Moorella sp. Hama-1]BCV22571.1 hypothetical protein hamaS1_26400 [Moorella sp. Hama-1]